jgi:hypothetical protein
MSAHGEKRPAMGAAPSTPKTTKPEEVFYIAFSYRFSAHRLYDLLKKYFPPDTGSGLVQSLFPTAQAGLILDLLAIEVFLKCLIQIETVSAATPQGHGLVDLFAQVSPKSQERIRQIYDSLEKPTNDPKMWEFDDVLGSLNKAFIQWRYAYEYSMGRTVYCTMLCEAIEKAILEIHPDLGQFRHIRVAPDSDLETPRSNSYYSHPSLIGVQSATTPPDATA